MKTQVIQLERFDDVTSVIDKITWSKADRVLLVWPVKGRVLQRPLDLLLVQRACKNLGVLLACIAEESSLLDDAQDLGIPVFKSIKTAQRLAWRRRKKTAGLELRPPRPVGELEDLNRKSQEAPIGWHKNWLARTALFCAGLAAVIALVLFMLPSAQISLVLPKSEFSVEIPLRASPEIAAVSLTGGLPVQEISVIVEGQASTPASGSIWLPEAKSAGRVQFTNLTAEGLTVPSGTIVQTQGSQSVRFKTTNEAVLSPNPGSKIQVMVEALEAGSQGNVGIGKISSLAGPLLGKIAVTNLENLIGGREARAQSASEADWQALQTRLQPILFQSAVRELAFQLGGGSRLIEETLTLKRIIEEKREPMEGVPATMVSLTWRAEFSAWQYQAADLDLIIKTGLDANRPGGFMGAGPAKTVVVTAPAVSGEEVKWKIRASQPIQAAWAESNITRAVAGKSVEQTQSNLASLLALKNLPEVTIQPEWWPWMPFIPGRIVVNIQ